MLRTLEAFERLVTRWRPAAAPSTNGTPRPHRMSGTLHYRDQRRAFPPPSPDRRRSQARALAMLAPVPMNPPASSELISKQDPAKPLPGLARRLEKQHRAPVVCEPGCQAFPRAVGVRAFGDRVLDRNVERRPCELRRRLHHAYRHHPRPRSQRSQARLGPGVWAAALCGRLPDPVRPVRPRRAVGHRRLVYTAVQTVAGTAEVCPQKVLDGTESGM